MGLEAAGQAAEGHYAGVSGGLCAGHHGEEADSVCDEQSRPEGQDAAD